MREIPQSLLPVLLPRRDPQSCCLLGILVQIFLPLRSPYAPTTPTGTDPAEADDAHWLLDFYSTFSNTDVQQEEDEILQEALQCLSR